MDGTIKIQPRYDSISVLDKEERLYIIKQFEKYGVVSEKGNSVIYPEYDKIGLDNTINTDNKYLMLDELIPVYNEGKWGAFNKSGKLVYDIVYDEFGYSLTSIEINGVKELVQPVLSIERANGVVVKKDGKYGLLDVEGKEMVPVAVEGIYSIYGVEEEKEKYFMLYKGEEINLIKRLIEKNVIEDDVVENPAEDENIMYNEMITNNITSDIGNNTEM